MERRRQEAMVEDLAQGGVGTRDKLEDLDESARACLEDHDIRVLVEWLHLDQALRVVEEEVRTLREARFHPRGT